MTKTIKQLNDWCQMYNKSIMCRSGQLRGISNDGYNVRIRTDDIAEYMLSVCECEMI